MRYLRGNGLVGMALALFVGAVAGAAALPSSASAQIGFNLWRSGDADLSSEDLQLLRHAVREALNAGVQDATVAWTNPDSGFSGDATLLRAFEADDGDPCGDVKVTIARRGQATELNLTLCQREDGTWGIAPQ